MEKILVEEESRFSDLLTHLSVEELYMTLEFAKQIEKNLRRRSFKNMFNPGNLANLYNSLFLPEYLDTIVLLPDEIRLQLEYVKKVQVQTLIVLTDIHLKDYTSPAQEAIDKIKMLYPNMYNL
jgi:hypothetical protein